MNNLKTIRIAKNLTQKQVAEGSGVSISVYCRYEIGERTPSLRAASAIAAYFGCSIDELFREPAASAN